MRSLAQESGVCISAFVRGPLPAAAISELLRRTDDLLVQAGTPADDRQHLLDPFKEQLSARDHPVAVFRSAQRLEDIPMPASVSERLMVENRFFLTPLLPLLGPAGEFDVLTITRKDARLLHVDPAGAHGGALVGIDAINGGRGFRNACRAVSHVLRPLLAQRRCPLLLAGAPAEVATYASVNDFDLTINPRLTLPVEGRLSDDEIRRRAEPILSGWIDPAARAALASFDQARLDLRLLDLPAIAKAATDGRIACLLWGNRPSPDADLENVAVVETLRADGEIVIVPAEFMPERASVAAVLRY